MFKRTLFLSSILLLSACAYAIDKQIQDIEFTAKGAEDALCHIYTAGTHYKVRPPGIVTVSNTEQPMMVDCLAPGNRRTKFEVPAKTNATTFLNLGNAGAGLPWDYASGAMFKYPDEIVVDFTGIESRPQDLPAQNNPDIKQPEEYELEEFSPALPRMNMDKHTPPIEIVPRKLPAYETEAISAPSHVVEGDKGELIQVIKGLQAEQIDPTAPPPEAAPAATSAGEGGLTLPGDDVDPLPGGLPYNLPAPQYPGE